ncbi:MAG: hypothetical protein DSZ29_08120 [Aquificaceae bacterium]|nr:MAG: hypothetical protein DSZ29_08120 [Aquificaceae bacterium]
MTLDTKLFEQLASFTEISGLAVSQTNDGQLMESSISDKQIEAFISLLSTKSNSLANDLDANELHKVILKASQGDHFSFYLKDNQMLSVQSEAYSPIVALSQQIKALL